MTDALPRLLSSAEAPLTGQTVFVGFDAFVDWIVRPLRASEAHQSPRYFDRMEDFGRFVVQRAGRNGSVELEERMEKLGGNTPILANALGCLGAGIRAVAPFGSPAPHPCFAPLAGYGDLHSVGAPGLSIALEFDDGKFMLAMNRQINHLDYAALTAVLPPPRLIEILSGCDLLAFVNWSELPGSTDILAGLARDVLPALPREVPLLVDLSDCTRRSPAYLRDYLARLAALPPHIRTILSLNRNEADRVCEAMGMEASLSDIEKGRAILDTLRLEWVVFHERTHGTIVWSGGAETHRTRVRRPPVLQTGAGDNFNAGLCAGRLAGLDPGGALALASITSSFYVENGYSPAWNEIAASESIVPEEETP
jgi:hypothetical protein